MPTRTILGTAYQTVIMPDGKEWMAANLAWTGAGADYDNNSANRADYGRLYSESDVTLVLASLGAGWRFPTEAECNDLFALIGSSSALKLKTVGTSYWTTGNGMDTYGFAARGSGWYNGTNYLELTSGFYAWLDLVGAGYYKIFGFSDAAVNIGLGGALANDKYSIRLVRDLDPWCYESAEADYILALDWTEAADGTPVAYDDGAEYDYITATITARLKPDQLTTLEAAYQTSTRLWTLGSTGRLLGPEIDTDSVEVRLMDMRVDQPADSAMTLFDVTMEVHYGPLSAPSAGSLAAVIARGVPYHTPNPNGAAWITEGGASDVSAYSRVSTRRTMWYCQGLTHAEASDAVNYLRTLRGSSMVWTAPGTGRPFGPGEAQSATVWIPAWKLSRESNFGWMIELELVRNG